MPPPSPIQNLQLIIFSHNNNHKFYASNTFSMCVKNLMRRMFLVPEFVQVHTPPLRLSLCVKWNYFVLQWKRTSHVSYNTSNVDLILKIGMMSFHFNICSIFILFLNRNILKQNTFEYLIKCIKQFTTLEKSLIKILF